MKLFALALLAATAFANDIAVPDVKEGENVVMKVGAVGDFVIDGEGENQTINYEMEMSVEMQGDYVINDDKGVAYGFMCATSGAEDFDCYEHRFEIDKDTAGVRVKTWKVKQDSAEIPAAAAA